MARLQLTVGREHEHVATLHCAVYWHQGVVPDHYEAPDCHGQGQPDGDVVDDDAKVGMEPHVGCPAPGKLLFVAPVVVPQETPVQQEGEVLHVQQDVGQGHP